MADETNTKEIHLTTVAKKTPLQEKEEEEEDVATKQEEEEDVSTKQEEEEDVSTKQKEEEDVSNKQEEEDISNKVEDLKVHFCSHVGWDGLLIILSTLGLSGIFVFISYRYTSNFRTFTRQCGWLVIWAFHALRFIVASVCEGVRRATLTTVRYYWFTILVSIPPLSFFSSYCFTKIPRPTRVSKTFLLFACTTCTPFRFTFIPYTFLDLPIIPFFFIRWFLFS